MSGFIPHHHLDLVDFLEGLLAKRNESHMVEWSMQSAFWPLYVIVQTSQNNNNNNTTKHGRSYEVETLSEKLNLF